MPEDKKGVLEKLKKSSIRATDIAAQYWCEKQMELGYIYGEKYTKAMQKGKRVHELLQAEVATTIDIEPQGYPDFLYKEAYENYLGLKSLNERGIGREIKVYGSINGYKISGKIDELKVKDGKVVIVDTKTREINTRLNSANNPREIRETTMRPHKVQIMLYRKLLGDLQGKNYTYKNFYNSYGIKDMHLSEKFIEQLKFLKIDGESGLDEVYKRMFEELYKMPQISDQLELRYVDRANGKEFAMVSIDYKEEDYNKLIFDSMQYWRGEREAKPVVQEEAWKCNFCKFYGTECKVWWKK